MSIDIVLIAQLITGIATLIVASILTWQMFLQKESLNLAHKDADKTITLDVAKSWNYDDQWFVDKLDEEFIKNLSLGLSSLTDSQEIIFFTFYQTRIRILGAQWRLNRKISEDYYRNNFSLLLHTKAGQELYKLLTRSSNYSNKVFSFVDRQGYKQKQYDGLFKIGDNIYEEITGDNLLTAITNGTRDGIKMAVNVGAMLLVFLALIALINGILFQGADLFGINDWIKNNTVYESLSLELILGYIFAPLMWLIGIAKEDMTLMGQLLGVKLAASEFVAYIELASLKDLTSVIHLTYEKSVIMATIMLCGFANFASIGIQVAGIGILAPKKYKLLTELGFKAMIAGTLVSLLSATMVGMILG